MAELRFTIYKELEFSAAHFLRDYHGICERIHGHNYRVRIYVGADQLDTEGIVVDFVEVRNALERITERFDHTLLNDDAPFDELNPTAEHMARYIAEEVASEIDSERRRVTECHVWETDRNCAIYRR
jgi:6-pyruvoyltetrahydropterin/6-carboxytetrahydropterin synthase